MAKLKTKDQELKAQLVRALADYDNLVKRTQVEKSAWIDFAKRELLIKLLPIVDYLETAQGHLNDPGLTLVLSEFKKLFTEEGIVEIDTEGEFNENLHEAIDTMTDGEKNKIAEVALKGYKFSDGEIIRHAKVKVYK